MAIHLNPFAISNLIVIACSLPISVLIFFSSEKSKSAQYFGLHSFSIAWWGFFAFLSSTTSNPSLALILSKAAYSGVLFIPIFFLHSTVAASNHHSKALLFFAYSQAFLFLCLILNNTLISNVQLYFKSFYFIQKNIFYTTSFLFWIVFAIIAQLMLIKDTLKNRKIKDLFYIVPTIIAYSCSITNFFPALQIKLYPWGNFLVGPANIIAAYGILKYQSSNYKIVIKKSVLYTLLISLTTILYLIIVISLERISSHVLNYTSLTITVLIAFAIGLFVLPLKEALQKFIDKSILTGTPTELADQNRILKDEAARAQRLEAVSILASGLAHEIRNPLTAIKTFAEYLPEKMNDQKFLKQFSTIVGQESERINTLVQQLLDFAKPSTPAFQQCDIRKTVNETLDFLSSRFIQSHITVNNCVSKTAPAWLQIDPNQIRQVFLNIFINAVEAMPEGGSVTIRDEFPNNSSYRITISDTGQGINEDDLKHLFNPFYSKKDGGTGLGLSITHNIIKEHGGKILVASTPGKGTTFAIELPLKT